MQPSQAAHPSSPGLAWCANGKNKSMWSRWKLKAMNTEALVTKTYPRSHASSPALAGPGHCSSASKPNHPPNLRRSYDDQGIEDRHTLRHLYTQVIGGGT